jgi:uncharacterized protein
MASADWGIREAGAGLEVPLHVQPRARLTRIDGFHDGALKVKISAPPVDDAANRAILDFFSRLLRLPKSRICIISGEKSRKKVLRIEEMSLKFFQQSIAPHLR